MPQLKMSGNVPSAVHVNSGGLIVAFGVVVLLSLYPISHSLLIWLKKYKGGQWYA